MEALPGAKAFSVLRDGRYIHPNVSMRIVRRGPISMAGSIHPGNISQLFSFRGAEDSFYAKAVAYMDSVGKTNVLFWDQGRGLVGNNIHHRDALSFLVSHDSSFLARLAERDSIAGVKLDSDYILDQAVALESTANDLIRVRNLETMPTSIIERAQGFQFTARSVGGSLKVTDFSIDSSITAAQINHGLAVNAGMLSNMLETVHRAMDPEVVGYRAIGLLDKPPRRLLIDGSLQLPVGRDFIKHYRH